MQLEELAERIIRIVEGNLTIESDGVDCMAYISNENLEGTIAEILEILKETEHKSKSFRY